MNNFFFFKKNGYGSSLKIATYNRDQISSSQMVWSFHVTTSDLCVANFVSFWPKNWETFAKIKLSKCKFDFKKQRNIVACVHPLFAQLSIQWV